MSSVGNSEPAVPGPITGALVEISQQLWYRDFTDPRCPHDAWLLRFEMDIVGGDGDEDLCARTIRVVLLAPYHNGTITMLYRDVTGYAVALRDTRTLRQISRRRDWLTDYLERLPDGTLRHVIEWENQVWSIESRYADYEWIPA